MPLQSFVWSKSKNPKQQVLKPGHHEYYHSSKNLFRNTSPQHVHGKESRGCFSELQNFKITDFIVNVCLLCLLIYLFCGERSVRFVKTSELWTSQNNSSKTFFCLNMLSYLKPKHFAEKYQFHWPWDESVLQAVLYFTEIVGFILLHLGCNSLPPPTVEIPTWYDSSYLHWHLPPSDLFPVLGTIGTRKGYVSASFTKSKWCIHLGCMTC